MARSKKQSKENLNLEEQERKYKSIAPLAESFSFEIKNQIEKLLQINNISLGVPIEHRVKTWSSIKTKLENVTLQITDIEKMQDFIGLRLILLFSRDVESVIRLISENFEVIKKYNTQDRLSQDQFGYSSIHLVVKLKESWLAVPTLQNFNESKAEIQVRTLAQHIWAAASHTLQYKESEAVPPSVLRGIYRVSALLETVDLEFERVLQQRETYISNLKLNDSDEPLNVDLLEKILDEFFHKENKKENEPYGKTLKELTHFGILTANQLTDFIERNLNYAIDSEKEHSSLHLSKTFFTHNGLLRIMLANEFNTDLDKDFELLVHGIELAYDIEDG